METSDELQPDLLILIEDALEPLKMIVTWPKTQFDHHDLLEDSDLNHLQAESSFAIEWARIAGVDIDDVERWAPVLFENGLLFPDGGVASTARGYCLTRGMAVLDSVKTR